MTNVPTKEQADAALDVIKSAVDDAFPPKMYVEQLNAIRARLTHLEANQHQEVTDERILQAVYDVQNTSRPARDCGYSWPLIKDALSEHAELRSEVALKTVVYAAYRKGVEGIVQAARGLSFGEDWNNGTYAKIYRPKLIEAVKSLPTPPAEGGAE